jgi:nucleotide sugar dehydrogenase
VNIAFANSLALLADEYDVPVRAAIDLANTHPRVDILDPGPGVGGHCLPVDPLFLGESVDRTALVDAARAVNDSMPGHVVDLLRAELGNLDGTAVAVLGISYKGNVDDTRNSPGLAIGRELGATVGQAVPLADGGESPRVDVRFHDPCISEAEVDLRSLPDALRGADAAILAAAHNQFADLKPRAIGALLDERVVVDPVDLLEREAWTDQGFRFVEL